MLDSPMSVLWDEIRRDFPGLNGRVHLNAASSGLVPIPVRQAAAAYYDQLTEQGDEAWPEWMERREAARASVARFVGADPAEIAFVPNASTGVNLAADLLERDGAVLSDELEFPALTLPWLHRRVPVHFMPAVEGVVRLESFAEEQAPPAATIAISHVQFANGCRQDLEAFGALKGHRRLVVDASQSLGVFPTDVKRCRVDALVSAGNKWLGAGHGAGFVYIARELVEARPPHAAGWLSMQDAEAEDNRHCRLLRTNARTELGGPPFAPIFALGAAVDYLAGIGLERIAERVLALNMYLTFRLGRAGFEVLSPGGEYRSGQTLVRVDRPALARAYLKEAGVLVSEKPEGLRIATHFYNTEAEIDACLDALVAYRESLAELPAV
jgi:selenocysteine lyase/cysteine desulfurase